jgi:hypothetical protein
MKHENDLSHGRDFVVHDTCVPRGDNLRYVLWFLRGMKKFINKAKPKSYYEISARQISGKCLIRLNMP